MSASQQRRRPRKGLAHWVALAVLIHVELLLVIGLAMFLWGPRDADLGLLLAGGKGGAPESIDITTIDDDTARKILAEIEKQEEEQKKEEAKKEEEAPQAPGQVVDLAKPREEKRP